MVSRPPTRDTAISSRQGARLPIRIITPLQERKQKAALQGSAERQPAAPAAPAPPPPPQQTASTTTDADDGAEEPVPQTTAAAPQAPLTRDATDVPDEAPETSSSAEVDAVDDASMPPQGTPLQPEAVKWRFIKDDPFVQKPPSAVMKTRFKHAVAAPSTSGGFAATAGAGAVPSMQQALRGGEWHPAATFPPAHAHAQFPPRPPTQPRGAPRSAPRGAAPDVALTPSVPPAAATAEAYTSSRSPTYMHTAGRTMLSNLQTVEDEGGVYPHAQTPLPHPQVASPALGQQQQQALVVAPPPPPRAAEHNAVASTTARQRSAAAAAGPSGADHTNASISARAEASIENVLAVLKNFNVPGRPDQAEPHHSRMICLDSKGRSTLNNPLTNPLPRIVAVADTTAASATTNATPHDPPRPRHHGHAFGYGSAEEACILVQPMPSSSAFLDEPNADTAGEYDMLPLLPAPAAPPAAGGARSGAGMGFTGASGAYVGEWGDDSERLRGRDPDFHRQRRGRSGGSARGGEHTNRRSSRRKSSLSVAIEVAERRNGGRRGSNFRPMPTGREDSPRHKPRGSSLAAAASRRRSHTAGGGPGGPHASSVPSPRAGSGHRRGLGKKRWSIIPAQIDPASGPATNDTPATHLSPAPAARRAASPGSRGSSMRASTLLHPTPLAKFAPSIVASPEAAAPASPLGRSGAAPHPPSAILNPLSPARRAKVVVSALQGYGGHATAPAGMSPVLPNAGRSDGGETGRVSPPSVDGGDGNGDGDSLRGDSQGLLQLAHEPHDPRSAPARPDALTGMAEANNAAGGWFFNAPVAALNAQAACTRIDRGGRQPRAMQKVGVWLKDGERCDMMEARELEKHFLLKVSAFSQGDKTYQLSLDDQAARVYRYPEHLYDVRREVLDVEVGGRDGVDDLTLVVNRVAAEYAAEMAPGLLPWKTSSPFAEGPPGGAAASAASLTTVVDVDVRKTSGFRGPRTAATRRAAPAAVLLVAAAARVCMEMRVVPVGARVGGTVRFDLGGGVPAAATASDTKDARGSGGGGVPALPRAPSPKSPRGRLASVRVLSDPRLLRGQGSGEGSGSTLQHSISVLHSDLQDHWRVLTRDPDASLDDVNPHDIMAGLANEHTRLHPIGHVALATSCPEELQNLTAVVAGPQGVSYTVSVVHGGQGAGAEAAAALMAASTRRRRPPGAQKRDRRNAYGRWYAEPGTWGPSLEQKERAAQRKVQKRWVIRDLARAAVHTNLEEERRAERSRQRRDDDGASTSSSGSGESLHIPGPTFAATTATGAASPSQEHMAYLVRKQREAEENLHMRGLLKPQTKQLPIITGAGRMSTGVM